MWRVLVARGGVGRGGFGRSRFDDRHGGGSPVRGSATQRGGGQRASCQFSHLQLPRKFGVAGQAECGLNIIARRRNRLIKRRQARHRSQPPWAAQFNPFAC